MSSLVDWQIKKLAKESGLIKPYRSEQLNPASYDVVLGDTVLIETPGDDGVWTKVDISSKPLMLEPNEFVLAHTQEMVNIPENLEAIFCLKSSRGREGYNHALAAYIDPGFSGRVTLELKNYSRYRCLPLKAGMRIGQLRFSVINGTPLHDYSQTGRYQGAKTVEFSKG